MNERLKGIWRAFVGFDLEGEMGSKYPTYLVISENSVDFYEGNKYFLRKKYKDDDFSTVFEEKTHNCISSDGQVVFFFLDKSKFFIACRKAGTEGIEKDLEWKDIVGNNMFERLLNYFPPDAVIDMSKNEAEQFLNYLSKEDIEKNIEWKKDIDPSEKDMIVNMLAQVLNGLSEPINGLSESKKLIDESFEEWWHPEISEDGTITLTAENKREYFKQWSSKMSEDGTITLTKGDKQKYFKLIPDNGGTPVWENLEDGLFIIRARGKMYMYNLTDETLFLFEEDPDHRYEISWS